ncbi:MAG: bifunctional ornithine acetyltransferase/N-acetylglutamate synthase [Candidatus Raymondbacteria bacterium RifOxyA12_full_50_37]|uniref:Arginine biosynthesis bifunctional protein ArgJ n=1 Tax=Candidatus Raymondbacteria bacterium RIFOXYD12_FULL_49_13 TaxID=1817890 RepID=A0A1F7FKU0_UNCRA|nr:MAG: bifunctional ornithine acetyltransferase/N-acetylglutamate synthase [Candidatus Raymondbacteria bacterium RifOxyA12_full_50_37]OGJ85451.1 MAG: bifunctional ornithine acetyltransferase/N-acetylglutamate synthase [Candidatus Raymondbacteria bacterium RIFOXYA2_FULL_49_16]OGJ94959.1 MAG: bifunctional ornithine acetyltransferase/N-acetylglutamate synthase [Candidatus Raymondbacteria bacterium RIFOXYC2_FULL_50_21]OGJ99399.1 MAG: bifunctional ornithine acetyltransferase/N-acetylglutamate syntha
MKEIKGGITAPKGFLASGIACGIKKSGKPDLALLSSVSSALYAGAFTTNRFAAAPVVWCRKILARKKAIKAVVVNSGNANACTGLTGEKNARHMAELTAKTLDCSSSEVLVSSTGVIGHQLPMYKLEKGIPDAASRLKKDNGHAFATAILTTDLVSKQCAVEIDINGSPVRIAGCCKGSGMIHPNMATMLAFVTTDAIISLETLSKVFQRGLTLSFNRITVDGDTSTNDTCIMLANGEAKNPVIKSGKYLELFSKALFHVLKELARKIVADGEGATKTVSIVVRGAKAEAEADKAARAIANSPLVKTALFGNDPNWGRILAAAGYSGVSFDPSRVELTLCGIRLVKNGQPLLFDAKTASDRLKEKEVDIVVDLHSGKAQAEMLTCDFSYDYVKINAEYHT